MLTSDRLLFHQLRLGLIDPRPNYDNPKDAATRAMCYSALLVEKSGPWWIESAQGCVMLFISLWL